MSFSLVETGSLARQAARGAGMSWGMSEEAGFSVRCLESFQLPGAASLVALLEKNDGVDFDTLTPSVMRDTIFGKAGRLCPIYAGAAVCDFAHLLADGREITLENVDQPLLLTSFVLRSAAIIGAPVQVKCGDSLAVSDGYGLYLDGFTTRTEQSSAIISAKSGTGASADWEKPGMRAMFNPETLSGLRKFAGRTHAPATEESRLLGAGAGVSDND